MKENSLLNEFCIKGQGGGENYDDTQRFHPHPRLPPSRGKEFRWYFVTR